MSGDQLKGRVAFVTGAGSGIGRAVALRFAREGARVAAVDRDLDAVRVTASAAKNILAIGADVTKSTHVARAVAECQAAYENPDILVNCAASLGPGGAIEDTSEEDWDRLFEVNAKGVFLCVKHVAPLMRRARRGAIVNVASTAGLVGSAALGAYSSSKGAVVLMTRSLALRYAPDQVRVNCVCPGSIDTPMLKATFETVGPTKDDQAQMEALYLSRHPLGRFGRAEEVAAAILFLASDEASFITGAAIPVDGGRIA